MPKEETLHNIVYAFGADIGVGGGVRLMAEYARRDIRDAVKGMDTWAGYLAVRKAFGNWTPYASFSRLQTEPTARSMYYALYDNGFTPMQVYQQLAADYSMLFDQRTIAIGSAWRIRPTQKLKAEWGLTHIGNTSKSIDLPAGTRFSQRHLNVFSLGYHLVF